MSRLVMFIPVSSSRGAGEVMRCVTIASALQRAERGFGIHFLVNRHAPCRASIPFPTTELDDSPSNCNDAVIAALRALKPDLVVFDSAARKPPLRYCRDTGISTLFISSRRKTRERAFQPGRLALLDGVMLIQPRFVDGSLRWPERASCMMVGGKQVLSVDTVFDAHFAQNALPDLPRGSYALFSSGGGGTRENRPVATEIFYKAALCWSEQTGGHAIVLLGPNCATPERYPSQDRITVLGQVDTSTFTHLVANATGCVIGGGSGLAQALALNQLCVVVATGKDQPRRIMACAERGLVLPAQLDAADIAEKLRRLESDSALSEEITQAIVASGIRNGIAEVVNTIRLHADGKASATANLPVKSLFQPR